MALDLPVFDPNKRCAKEKSRRGDALLDRRKRKAEQTAAEQAVMKAALRRDLNTCRFPRCPFAKKGMVVDPAHYQQHRGAGGNPSGDRTERTGQIVALCRRHHDMLDSYGEIEIDHVDAALGADGPLVFSARNPETGRMEHVSTERVIGISTTRGL